jgi:hypothetical protein
VLKRHKLKKQTGIGGGTPWFITASDPTPSRKTAQKLEKSVKLGRKVKRRMEFKGIPLCIEFDPGEYKHWTGEDGEKGSTLMYSTYGYIDHTRGGDGMGIDIFLGSNVQTDDVWVAHADQHQREDDKIFLGFNTKHDAKECFRLHYPDWMLEDIKHCTIDELKEEIKKHRKEAGPVKV